MMQAIKCIALEDMRETAIPDSCVICLGNFDGVHAAHRELMRQTASIRATRFPTAVCAVFCFDPPSSDFLASAPIRHLATREEKLELFREMGMNYALLADFSAIRDLSPRAFAEDILRQQCHCVAAVCGFNFRFGKFGAGHGEELEELLGAPVLVREEITLDGETVSSTAIRHHLSQGEVERANRMLMRPYAIRTEVVHGKSLGQKMGAPTINQRFESGMLIPKHGVYVTECEVDGVRYRGVSNIGLRPTVESSDVANCETHLLDFSGDLYGRELSVRFLSFIRPERTFSSVEELQKQIERDVAAARAY